MILLDTHVWVWWLSDPESLSKRAAKEIRRAQSGGGIYVSVVSVWEIGMLVDRKRLQFTIAVEDWIRRSEAVPFLHFVPIDNTIALRSTRLPEYSHQDPADRMILATAMVLGKSLVTKDRRMRRYPHVRTVW